jgi:hypothetical protein
MKNSVLVVLLVIFCTAVTSPQSISPSDILKNLAPENPATNTCGLAIGPDHPQAKPAYELLNRLNYNAPKCTSHRLCVT